MSDPRMLLAGAVLADSIVVSPRTPDQDRPSLIGCPIPGSRLDTCRDCLAHVWITPQVALAALRLPIVCTFCFGGAMRRYAAHKPFGISGPERALHEDGGRCLCDGCLAKFSVMTGRQLTRAELTAAVASAAREDDRKARKAERKALRRERKGK